MFAPVGPVDTWPVVECNGVAYHVAPVYVAPVGLADVEALYDAWECEIPTMDMVDAVWRAADLRLDPYRVARFPNDYANGQSPEAIVKQLEKITRMVDDRPFRILAGTHKDFVRLPSGRIELYGWHDLTGKVIEKGATSHTKAYPLDYSQGARLFRRVEMAVLRPHVLADPQVGMLSSLE